MSAGDQPRVRRRPLPWLWIGAVVFALFAGWLGLVPRADQRRSVSTDAPADAVRTDPLPHPAGPVSSVAPGDSAELVKRIAAAADEIAKLVARLSPNRDLDFDQELLAEIRRILRELAAQLRSLPNEVVTAAIRAYLDSGEDEATGLGFKVGEGGLLTDSPSMRMFLLDLFADIDAPDAVGYSIGLLNASDSPGEWALALRNIAWQDEPGHHRELLRGRLSEMLDRQEWLADPDQGFLEVFDLAVHLGDADALREMGSVLGLRDAQGKLANNGITHAAFLAMDRLTAADPGQTVGLIQSDPEFLDWAPRHRGALMSRADVRDPEQAAAAGQYLLRADVGREERFAFLQLFPNPNGVLADSLISTPATPMDVSSGMERDRAALELVRGWLRDSRFQGVRTELLATEARLARFVPSGEPSGAGK